MQISPQFQCVLSRGRPTCGISCNLGENVLDTDRRELADRLLAVKSAADLNRCRTDRVLASENQNFQTLYISRLQPLLLILWGVTSDTGLTCPLRLRLQ